MRLTLFAIAALCLTTTFAATEAAAQSPSHALDSAWEQGTGALAALKVAGAKPNHYNVAERLPSGNWLVAANYTVGALNLQIPVKLSPQFELIWTPDRAYIDALLGMLKSGALPPVEGPEWTRKQRLPAFPAVVTAKRIVTPFGVIPFEPAPKVEPDEELMRHTGRWINEVLDQDPGPASFDILADADLAWVDIVRVIYSISAAGLFEINFVGPGTTDLAAISGLSPIIFGQIPESTAVVSIGVSIEGDMLGFRVAIGSELVPPMANSCAAQMTFCANDKTAFQAALQDVPGAGRVVLAPEFAVPFRSVVEITSWPTTVPVLSIVSP